MISTDLKILKHLIITVADYYGRQLSPETVTMMAGDLSDLPLEAIKSAYDHYRRDDKVFRFPLPAQIRAIVTPIADPDSQAQEAAGRVIQAIGKYGWPHPTQARAYIGELGWRAVERFGGWLFLCENVGVEINQTTIYAQIRDLTRATVKLGNAGIHDQPIGLPGQTSKDGTNELTSALDVIKAIPGLEERSGNNQRRVAVQDSVGNKSDPEGRP